VGAAFSLSWQRKAASFFKQLMGKRKFKYYFMPAIEYFEVQPDRAEERKKDA
jgi:hypothetical protein